VRTFDLKEAWLKAISDGTALCRGGCGDRPTIMRFTGKLAGCWCRGCWTEVYHGKVPGLDQPTRRK
jgi:hypothetical protein